MSKQSILFVWALVAFSLSAASGRPPYREQESALRLQKPGQPPAASFLLAEKPAVNLAAKDVFPLGKSSGSSRMNPALRVALGFMIPGLLQYLDGHWRSYGYFAVEGVSVAGLIVLNSQGNSRQQRYIQLSRLARSNYVYPGLRNNPTEVTDPSLPGYGEYYEDLTKWPSSGDYDDDPSQEGVQPESNPGTYNGHQWEIAGINNFTGTNGGLPVPANPQEEINAIEAYKQKVYPIEYNWDWTGLDLENERYHEFFESKEAALRRRSTFATILLANHLVSGLDILIQERINRSRRMRAARLRLHLETAPLPDGLGIQPRVSVSHRF